jgi:hypothetical protein
MPGGGCRGLLRRRRSLPPEVTAAVGVARQETTVADGVPGAATRGTMERGGAAATSAVGLAPSEVRRGTGGSRPLTLAMGA